MIAIQNSKSGFHPHWVEYCKKNNIPFKLVNCYDNDIIEQLEDCKILFWHHHHNGPKDILIAKQLLYALEHTGFRVFPDFKTGWHFDDKIAQKYLFERIGAPLVPTYLFLDKKEAIDWANKTTFPKILKLRGGAGSLNVKLIRSRKQAISFINKAFRKGISNYDAVLSVKERWHKFKKGRAKFLDVMVGLARLVIKPDYLKIKNKEVGYVYFQDFIEGLDRDYRTKVLDSKCWGYQRMVRKGDFRASGSGAESYIYTDNAIPDSILKLSFELAHKLSLKNAAFDFLIAKDKVYLVEVSCFYGFHELEFHGYWDEQLNFHKETFNPFGWMIESELKALEKAK